MISTSTYYFKDISIIVESLWSTSNEIRLDAYDPWILEKENREIKQMELLQFQRNKQRERNCRPPSYFEFAEDRYESLHFRDDKFEFEKTSLHDKISESLREKEKDNSQPKKWIQELCDGAKLKASSRVLIINPLTTQLASNSSATLGTASLFTLFIARHCGVKNIIIADSMQPNTKKHRLQSMNTFRTLYRDITGLELVVPLATAGLARKEDEDLEVKWLKNFSPTHVLHFENANQRETKSWDEHLSTKGQQLFHIKNSILSMQQLMHHCDERSKSGASNRKFRIADKVDSLVFLHVVITDSWNTNEKNTTPIHSMLTDYFHMKMNQNFAVGVNKGIVHLHHLHIPSYVSQLVYSYDNEQPKFFSLPDEKLLSINSHKVLPVIAGIMHALQSEEDHRRRIMSISSETSSLAHLSVPADVEGSLDFYGIHNVRFPCATSCKVHSSYTCSSSVLDSVALVSSSATLDCLYVIYTVVGNTDVDNDMKLRIKTDGGSSNVCRVAYASSQNPMIQNALRHLFSKDPSAINDLDKYNGKLETSDGAWTFVLFPQLALGEAEMSLFRIDPSQLFASNVRKAMYVSHASNNVTTFLPNGEELYKMLTAIDFVEGQATKPRLEYRSGNSNVFRILEAPSSSRTVLLHARESPNAPAKFGEYLEHLGKEENFKISSYRHLNFYKQMNHYIQMGDNRPSNDVGPGKFKTSFPWQWISMESYIHDLWSEPASQLRCLWYEAHLSFGESNLIPDTEDLSLAYVIGKQRLEGYLGPNQYDDASWIPVMKRGNGKSGIHLQDEGEEFIEEEVDTMSDFFIRVMQNEVAVGDTGPLV